MTFVRNNLLAKLMIATALLAACANADVLYTATTTDSLGNPDSGSADFFLSGCAGNGTGCTLNVELINTEPVASITTVAQALSGVTFSLTTASTSLNFTGATLSSTITSDGVSAAVPDIISSSAYSSTNSVGTWQIHGNQHIGTGTTNWGPGALELTVLGHGTPQYLIDPSGMPLNNNIASSHLPVLLGPVYFQITGITNLTTSTTISNVDFLWGTSAEGVQAESTCTQSGGGNCNLGTIGTQGPTPEPVSFLLAGTGLAAIVLMRRRLVSAR